MQLTNSFNMNLLFKILENKYELKLTRANEDNYINFMIQAKKKKKSSTYQTINLNI